MKDQINNKYNLEIEEIIKNEDSTDGNVYILINHSNKYIAKLYDSKKHTISMVNIHEHLKNGGMNVPEIILNKENQGYSLLEDGKYCVIYSFLNGEEIGNLFKNINKDISIKIAKEIKKIHQIKNGNNKISIATDLGHITPEIINNLKDSSFVLLEANYDPEILKFSRYPYYLKQRISGINGHLSNIDAGNLLSKLIGVNLNSIMLGHLSKENNFPELAYKTVVDELMNNKCDVSKLDINVATRIRPSKIIKIS